MDVKKIMGEYSTLKNERAIYETEWQEYVDTYMPLTQSFTSMNKPVQPITAIAPHGKNALNTLSAYIHYGLISSGTKWFEYVAEKENLTHDQLLDLDKLNKRILNTITDTKNGFDQAFLKFVSSQIVFGCGCIHVENNLGSNIIFTHIPLSQYYIQKKPNGKVDYVVRSFKLTARQAIDVFGYKNVHEKIIKCYENNSLEQFEFIHRTQVDLKTKKVESTYVDAANQVVVKHNSLKDFPFVVGIWAAHDGETYGHGQAKLARSTMRFITKTRINWLNTSTFTGNPAYLVPHDGVIFPDVLSPGAKIYGGIDPLTGNRSVEPLQTGASTNDTIGILQFEIDQLNQAFYIDKIVPPIDKTRRTAYESALIDQSQRQAITPHVSSNVSSLTDVVDLVFNLMTKNGQFKDLQSLQGLDLKVNFLSPLAKLLKMEDVRATQEFLQMSLPLLQFEPSLAARFDFKNILIDAQQGTGAPAHSLRSEKEAEEILKAAAEQQQQQGQMQNALAASEITKNIGDSQ